jgi:hypothetical protein
MYEFFDSMLKKKAFVRALKEVDAEGIDNILAEASIVGGDVIPEPINPDIGSVIKNLSKREAEKPQEKEHETLDISGFAEENKEPTKNDQEDKPEATSIMRQGRTRHTVEETFGYSPSFLEGGTSYSDIEFIDETKPRIKSEDTSARDAEYREIRRRRNDEILRRMTERAEKAKAAAAEQPETQQNETHIVEISKEPTQEKPVEAAKETIKEEKPAEADSEKSQEKAKKTTARKRKRKYDADIIGGIDY